MEIITRKSLARTAAERYKSDFYYSARNVWRIPGGEHTYFELLKLGYDPSPDEVDRVIGNGGWTREHCAECGTQSGYRWFVFGTDYETSGTVCESCLELAIPFLGLK